MSVNIFSLFNKVPNLPLEADHFTLAKMALVAINVAKRTDLYYFINQSFYKDLERIGAIHNEDNDLFNSRLIDTDYAKAYRDYKHLLSDLEQQGEKLSSLSVKKLCEDLTDFLEPGNSALYTEERLTEVLTRWVQLVNGYPKSCLCPENTLLSAELNLSHLHNFVSYTQSPNILALKLLLQLYSNSEQGHITFLYELGSYEKMFDLDDNHFSYNRARKYDTGFCSPYFNRKCTVNNQTYPVEAFLLKNMLEKITGRFIFILPANLNLNRNAYQFLSAPWNISRLQMVISLPMGFIPHTQVMAQALLFAPQKSGLSETSFIDLNSPKLLSQLKDNGEPLNLSLAQALNGIFFLNKDPYELSLKISHNEIVENQLNLNPAKYLALKTLEQRKDLVVENLEDQNRESAPQHTGFSPNILGRYVIGAAVVALVGSKPLQDEAKAQRVNESFVKLGTIAEIYRAQAPRLAENGHKFNEILISNIDEYGVIKGPFKEVKIDTNQPKNRLRKGDLIFSIKGTVGKCALVSEEPQNLLAGQSFVIIRVKDPKWTPELLYWQLNSNMIKDFLRHSATGAVVQLIKMDDLKNLPIVIATAKLNEQAQECQRQKEQKIKQIQNLQAELESLSKTFDVN